MDEFLEKLTALSKEYSLFVTEWMDDLAVIDNSNNLVSYVHWDERREQYVETNYMNIPD